MYDRWQRCYGKDFSELILPRLLTTLRTHRIRPATMLDVGCGTGTMARMMARRGWRVWGVDASEGMLEEAVKKLGRWRGRVTLLRQEMTRISLPEPVSLVVSLFDTLNHLASRRALLAAFRAIRASLLPGGHFIFDLNGELCFKTLWTQTQSLDQKDFSIILRNEYEARKGIATSHVTLFLREDDRYRREQEIVRERCFPDHEVAGLLSRTGFTVKECVPFNFSQVPQLGNLKTWWVAQAAAPER